MSLLLLGTNKADDVVLDSALDFYSSFHTNSESLPKADEGTTISTQ